MNRIDNQNSNETINANETIVEIIKQVQNKYPEYKNYFVNGIIKFLKEPNKLVMPCYAAQSFCYIDSFWNVYPCMNMNEKLGNLRKNNFMLLRFSLLYHALQERP